MMVGVRVLCQWVQASGRGEFGGEVGKRVGGWGGDAWVTSLALLVCVGGGNWGGGEWVVGGGC